MKVRIVQITLRWRGKAVCSHILPDYDSLRFTPPTPVFSTSRPLFITKNLQYKTKESSGMMKTPFRLLLFVAPLLSRLTCVDGGGQMFKARQRPLDMTCIIDETHNEPTALQLYEFKYYYAMGYINEVGEEEMQQLERNLFEAIRERIIWCYHQSNLRKLVVNIDSAMEYNSRQLRELGIVAFTMAGMDRDTPCKSDSGP